MTPSTSMPTGASRKTLRSTLCIPLPSPKTTPLLKSRILLATSFSAPVFAGQVALALQLEFERGDVGSDPASAVARARRVLADQPKRALA